MIFVIWLSNTLLRSYLVKEPRDCPYANKYKFTYFNRTTSLQPLQ